MISFLDTSAILNGALGLFENIHLSPLVLTELENIKNSSTRDQKIKFMARQVIRNIISSNEIVFETSIERQKVDRVLKKNNFLTECNDHKILSEALILSKTEDIRFITSDGTLFLFARNFPELHPYYFLPKEEERDDDYCGWGRYYPTEEQFAQLYTTPEVNVLEVPTNHFVELFEGNELKDIMFWDGKKYRKLQYKEFTTALGERVKPRNPEQRMYLDLLQNKDIPIKLCMGKFGSGKSYLATTYALGEIRKGRFDRMVFVKNNLEVRGAGRLGTLPGGEIDKQMPWLKQLEDFLGTDRFIQMLNSGQIEPAHLSSLRGRDLRNSIIFVDEAENLLTSNLQLIIGRAAQNTEIVLCADTKQCDYPDAMMSGIPTLVERFKGQPLFGMVKLIKTERSDVAAMADLLD